MCHNRTHWAVTLASTAYSLRRMAIGADLPWYGEG